MKEMPPHKARYFDFKEMQSFLERERLRLDEEIKEHGQYSWYKMDAHNIPESTEIWYRMDAAEGNR